MSEYLDIHALADGELTPEQADALRAQLASHPGLDAELQSILLVKSTLRSTIAGVSDAECWSQCRERIAAIDRTSRTNSFVSRYSWAMCGSLIAGILIVGAAQRGMNSSKPFDPNSVPLLASAFSAPGTASTPKASQFDRWLNRVRVLEQRVGTFDGKPASRSILQDGNGRYLLFIVADCKTVNGACPEKKFVPGEVDGMNTISWAKDGYAFTLIGKNQTSELELVATRMFAPR